MERSPNFRKLARLKLVSLLHKRPRLGLEWATDQKVSFSQQACHANFGSHQQCHVPWSLPGLCCPCGLEGGEGLASFEHLRSRAPRCAGSRYLHGSNTGEKLGRRLN